MTINDALVILGNLKAPAAMLAAPASWSWWRSTAAVDLLSGRFSEASPSMFVLAGLFVVKYAVF